LTGLSYDLDGKVALVTGAAGAIGSATALALAKSGADIIINHFQTPVEAETLKQSIVMLGRRAHIVDADVSDEHAVLQMFSQIDQHFGRIDILINNAGIARAQTIFDMTLESWNEVISTNLTSVFLCSRAAMLRMREAKHGRIIQIGSVVGHQGALKGHIHYASAKAGMLGFTKTLARTGAPLGITVNLVAPGIVRTPMLEAIHGEQGIAELRKAVPLDDLATPKDVAAAVVYLCGPGGRHITGTVIDINGGMLMR
jgi:3-oxoacyl-[acyl-carrier protein] reductase